VYVLSDFIAGVFAVCTAITFMLDTFHLRAETSVTMGPYAWLVNGFLGPSFAIFLAGAGCCLGGAVLDWCVPSEAEGSCPHSGAGSHEAHPHVFTVVATESSLTPPHESRKTDATQPAPIGGDAEMTSHLDESAVPSVSASARVYALKPPTGPDAETADHATYVLDDWDSADEHS